MEQAAHLCFEEIISQTKRPLYIGVVGDSGSGKSYLVGQLVEKLQKANLSYSLINHDEFLISRNDREPMKTTFYETGKFAGKSHWEILENMFRLDEYERVIQDLQSGKATSFHPYARETGSVGSEERTVEPKDFMIFDTSMMIHKMDYVILVDVTQENIIKRKLARDSDIRTPEQIVDMHTKVQGYYWEDRGRPDRANIVIDNNNFDNVKVTVNR
jgi:uridine kinase